MIGTPLLIQLHAEQVHHHQRSLEDPSCIIPQEGDLQGEGVEGDLRGVRGGGECPYSEAVG